MPLPDIGSKEWSQEIEFYLSADQDAMFLRAKDLGLTHESYTREMRGRGIHRTKGFVPPTETETGRPIVNLPPVRLLDFQPPHPEQGDEEIAVLHCSDGHAGRITKSFNKTVYRDRMYKMFESTMVIVNLHRHMYPVRKLRIVHTGDACQGENPFQGSVVGSVEMGSRDQLVKLAIPVWNDIIGSFKQNFEEVEFDGVPGNHGADRIAPATSKLDLEFYDMLQLGIGQQKGIKINVHEGFSDVISINGFRFFIFHGDTIPCSQGVPLVAITKKLQAWYIQTPGGFNYALGGHFHKRLSDEVASRFEFFLCSTLVSDDEWALGRLGISSNPSQWLFGVHAHRGVTWRYPLTVDDKCLPEKES